MHIYNRGNRKAPIVKDSKDKWRFLRMLYYFNNRFNPPNIFRELKKLFRSDLNRQFVWPRNWPSRKPIVKILAFALLENHFHLLVSKRDAKRRRYDVYAEARGWDDGLFQ